MRRYPTAHEGAQSPHFDSLALGLETQSRRVPAQCAVDAWIVDFRSRVALSANQKLACMFGLRVRATHVRVDAVEPVNQSGIQ